MGGRSNTRLLRQDVESYIERIPHAWHVRHPWVRASAQMFSFSPRARLSLPLYVQTCSVGNTALFSCLIKPLIVPSALTYTRTFSSVYIESQIFPRLRYYVHNEI